MSTDTPSLDKIDMKIIHLLQHNARMSIAELADLSFNLISTNTNKP